MTEQQIIFAEQYIVDRNGTAAAIRSGYSTATARQIAYKLLKTPDIQEYIKEKLSELSKSTLLDVEWALNRYKDISDRCMRVEPVLEFIDGEWRESGEYKFDGMAAKAATDSIVKILGGFEKDNDQKKPILPTSIQLIVAPSPTTPVSTEKDLNV